MAPELISDDIFMITSIRRSSFLPASVIHPDLDAAICKVISDDRFVIFGMYGRAAILVCQAVADRPMLSIQLSATLALHLTSKNSLLTWFVIVPL